MRVTLGRIHGGPAPGGLRMRFDKFATKFAEHVDPVQSGLSLKSS